MSDIVLLEDGGYGLGDDVATGGSRAIALVEGGAPPSEYLMFAPGINETVKGPLLFDDEAAKAVEAFYAERGRKRLAGDWEHDSMVPAESRPANYKGSPASHWFALEVRPGPELWAVDVKWTPTAFAQIQAGEYAHTSPVVKFQKATGRIVAVLSSALTNDPATIGQPQLVAASAESTKPLQAATPEKTPMDPTQAMGTYKMADEPAGKVKAIVDGAHKDEAEMAGKLKACLAESFPAHFGQDHKEPDGDEGAVKMADKTLDPAASAKLADKPEDDEEKKEMKALRADLERITGKKTRSEQIAVLTAMKIQSEEVVTLSAKLAEKSTAAFDAEVERARKAMRLTPADCAPDSRTKRGQYISSLRASCDVVALKAFTEQLGAVVTTDVTAAKEAKAGESTVVLTAEERVSVERNGMSITEYIKNKQARLSEGDAFRP